MLQKAKETYAFGRFRLDVAGYRLLCGGEEVRLEPKAFDLLLYFLENPGEVLSHREIKKRVWERDFVEDDSVYRKIADLRGVFRKYDPSCKYIRNIPGRGWRFEVDVAKCLGDAPLASHGGLVGGQPIEARGTELAGASACATEERPVGAVREDAGLVDGSGSQGPINNRPQVGQPPPQVAGGRLRKLIGIAAVAVTALTLAVIVVGKSLSPANWEPHVTYRQLTWDGRPKEGPLVSDGRFVYFSERPGEAQDGPVALAAVPISGGDVLFPPNPVNPAAQILSIARNTQDMVYGRWSTETVSCFTSGGRSNVSWSAGHRIRTSAAARMSPDGRSIAYVTESERNGALIIRDLGDRPNARRIAVSGLPRTLAWSPDGSNIRFPVFDPISETAVFWEACRDGGNPHRLPLVSRPHFDLRDGMLDRGWPLLHLQRNIGGSLVFELVDTARDWRRGAGAVRTAYKQSDEL